MKYVVIYGEDGGVLAAAPADGDRPIVSEGEQAAEVDLPEEWPDFDRLYFDADSRSFKFRGDVDAADTP
jgi:hypothetical protein